MALYHLYVAIIYSYGVLWAACLENCSVLNWFGIIRAKKIFTILCHCPTKPLLHSIAICLIELNFFIEEEVGPFVKLLLFAIFNPSLHVFFCSY